MGLVVRSALGFALDMLEPQGCTGMDAVKAFGARVVFRYANNLTAAELQGWTERGIGVGIVGESRSPGWMPSDVTGEQDASVLLDRVHALSIPSGATLFDDIEGPASSINPLALMSHVNVCSSKVAAASFIAGVYIGYGALLTSEEWMAFRYVHRYWKSGSRVLDRFGKLVEPSRGWCVIQALPFNLQVPGGPKVDMDLLLEDFLGGRAMVVWEEEFAPAE